MLHRATHAVGAALRGYPQIQTLVVGFAGQVEAAIRQCFFQIGQGECRLTRTEQGQALAGHAQAPVRFVAIGAQQQALKTGFITGRSFTLDTVHLAELQLPGDILGCAGTQLATDIGEQWSRAVGEQFCRLAHDIGRAVVADTELALLAARTKQQATAAGAQLTLQALQGHRGLRLLEYLTTGEQRHEGEQQGTGRRHGWFSGQSAATLPRAWRYLKGGCDFTRAASLAVNQ